MRPNDETIYTGIQNENEENPQVVNENESKKGESWKMVSLGAATGILIGAGAIYASSAMAEDSNETPETPEQPTDNTTSTEEPSAAINDDTDINVAHTTSGNSFSQAFAEARAEVGPGGVFHWNGGVYSTYTQEEWDAMSDQEKDAFVESARPEFGVEHANTAHHVAQHVVEPQEPQNVNITVNQYHIHENNENAETGGEEDVHIVTHLDTNIDVDSDGDLYLEHQYDVDGHQAIVRDYVDEDFRDVAWVDKNDNQMMDDGEIMDMNSGDVLNTDGTLYYASNDDIVEPSVDTFEV